MKKQLLRSGTGRYRAYSVEERWAVFMRHVDPDRVSGCWLWTGSLSQSGYGRMWDGQRDVPAHRWAYEQANGTQVPKRLEMDHLCRTRRCVNPEHVEPVTSSENTRRGLNGALKTHCPNGHVYAGRNVAYRADGRRYCAECSRKRCLANYHRRKNSVVEIESEEGE